MSKCHYCQHKQANSLCGNKCGIAQYCGQACANADYPSHRDLCLIKARWSAYHEVWYYDENGVRKRGYIRLGPDGEPAEWTPSRFDPNREPVIHPWEDNE